MSNVLNLDAILDLKAAQPLKVALSEHRGTSVQIDASNVERLGGLCLQVLVAARRAWAEEGQDMKIEPRSAAFDAAVTLFAAEPHLGAPAENDGAVH
jgi:chemotaxis protein CheX